MPRLPKREKDRSKEPWGKSTNQKFYNSSVWRALRRTYIMQHPLCAAHDAQGLVVEANVVDHVIPIAAGGAKLSPRNLQSLCAQCHNRKSAIEKEVVLEKIVTIEGFLPTDEGKKQIIQQLIRFI